jgi:DNA-binding MarR family transcriptional regulator
MKKLLLDNFLPYRLNRIASAVSRDFRAVYGRHYDLTVPEWRVLATLGEFEEMGATAIGAHSAMHKTKVSRAVRALEKRRWLKRREVPQDRREEILSLTRMGQEAYAEIIPRALAFEHGLLEGLGADAKALLQALERLEAHVGVRP